MYLKLFLVRKDQEEKSLTNNMDIVDLKIWGVNSFAITISLLDIDAALSVALGFTAIGYTIHKWYLMWKYNRKKNNES